MTWYKIRTEIVARGDVFVEADTPEAAQQLVVDSTMDDAIRTQEIRHALQEKVSFTPLSVTEQIEGVDYQ